MSSLREKEFVQKQEIDGRRPFRVFADDRNVKMQKIEPVVIAGVAPVMPVKHVLDGDEKRRHIRAVLCRKVLPHQRQDAPAQCLPRRQ